MSVVYPPIFEYIFTGELTPVLEERTKLIIENITKSIAPFSLVKYFDEPITEDKKTRTFILISTSNITTYLCSTFFNDCNMKLEVFYKQRVI